MSAESKTVVAWIERPDSGTVEPYSTLAELYDRVVGNAFFNQIRSSFEIAVRRYRVHFRSAADIGCGTGTFAAYLSRFGIPVFAVDGSPAMLAIAARKNRGRYIQFLQQDLRQLRLPHPVDLITCNHDTLNYLLRLSELTKVVERCRENLSPNGHFIFDLIVRRFDASRSHHAVQHIVFPDVRAIWRSYWEPRAGLSIVKMTFSLRRNGSCSLTSEVHVQRWYSLSSLKAILLASGFRLRGIHDAEDMRPITRMTSWVRFVAQST